MRPIRLAVIALLASGCGSTSSDDDGAAFAGSGGAGAGGTGADGGAGVGGTTNAPMCGAYDHSDARMSMSVVGPVAPAGAVFDEPAHVERSTTDQLILYFETSAGDGSEEPVVRHASFDGLEPMPILPIGAQLWLSKSPASEPPYYPLNPAAPSRAVSVRDRQDGTLLFGSAVNNTSNAAPLTATVGGAICVDPNPSCRGEGAELIYHSLEVQGDSPVTIEDSNVATVSIGGIDYDVWATARAETGPSSPADGCAADYHPLEMPIVSLDVRAKDLAALVETLDMGELPACVHGNAPRVGAYFSLYEVSNDPYEGPVFYERQNDSGNEFLFGVVGLTSTTDLPPMLSVAVDGNFFSEPSFGTELWAALPNTGLGSLREAGGGPLVLASATLLSTPFDAATAAMLEDLVGVPVTAEERCVYAEDVALWDVVVQTDPPVRVLSGEESTLELDGREYAVWAWGERFVSFTIYLR